MTTDTEPYATAWRTVSFNDFHEYESRLRQDPHGLEPRDPTVAEPLNSRDADDLPGPQRDDAP